MPSLDTNVLKITLILHSCSTGVSAPGHPHPQHRAGNIRHGGLHREQDGMRNRGEMYETGQRQDHAGDDAQPRVTVVGEPPHRSPSGHAAEEKRIARRPVPVTRTP
jgi:hypothetical protein